MPPLNSGVRRRNNTVRCMPATVELHTPRLLLRQWRDTDREPFARMNADPEVMRYFPSVQSRERSDAGVDALSQDIAARGWGFWAAERRDTHEFIGFVGITVPRHPLPCMPCVEIGWRLAQDQWHQGYATEAARVSLRFGFEELRLDEVVAFTALGNHPSRAVMTRLGMICDPQDDFDHPAVPEGSAVRRHCLYRLPREEWRGDA
jgi:RimJ/RimL family protein N-acetyltransferase